MAARVRDPSGSARPELKESEGVHGASEELCQHVARPSRLSDQELMARA
jgi:hypothetical protein